MNKCDGIKILELDPKRILEGNEYMVIAEKDQNFKAPINQIVDLVINDGRLKDYIDATVEFSIGDFKNEVNQSISELTNKINNLDSKITTVNNRITNLESSINDIEQNITSINNKITSIENNLGRDFTYQSTSNTSINGYVTFNNKQYKVWNQQINIDGTILVQSSSKCINTTNASEAIELRVVALKENGSVYIEYISTEFRFGYVAGNSEKRGQQFIRSYVNSEGGNGKKAEEEFAVVNYFDKTEAGQVVALNPIT